MSLLPKSIHRCRRYPTKFNSGRDIPNLPPADVLAPGGDAQCFGSAGIELLDPFLHPHSVQEFFGLRHTVDDLGVRVFAVGLVDAPDRPLKSICVTHELKDTTARASLHPTPWTRMVMHGRKDVRAGNTTDEFAARQREANRPPTFGRNTLGALVTSLGLTATSTAPALVRRSPPSTPIPGAWTP